MTTQRKPHRHGYTYRLFRAIRDINHWVGMGQLDKRQSKISMLRVAELTGLNQRTVADIKAGRWDDKPEDVFGTYEPSEQVFDILMAYH